MRSTKHDKEMKYTDVKRMAAIFAYLQGALARGELVLRYLKCGLSEIYQITDLKENIVHVGRNESGDFVCSLFAESKLFKLSSEYDHLWKRFWKFLMEFKAMEGVKQNDDNINEARQPS